MMSRLIKGPKRNCSLTLIEYYKKRNDILIIRYNGGLGDILVHRMIFKNFKTTMPDARIIFACPKMYHDAVRDHPYIDEVQDSRTVNTENYVQIYNTSNACCRYELAKAPYSGDNRSDIWAGRCGVTLTDHNMYFNLDEETIAEGRKTVEQKRNSEGPSVLFAPISAMYNKNLTPYHMATVVHELRNRGMYVFASHTSPIKALHDLNVPHVIVPIKKWMGVVNAADYIISVDTAALHMGGGLGKPLLGIFTFTDGKVYMRYYTKTILVQKHRDNGDWNCGPCYNWTMCSKTKLSPKPCLTEIMPEMLIDGIDRLFARFN